MSYHRPPGRQKISPMGKLAKSSKGLLGRLSSKKNYQNQEGEIFAPPEIQENEKVMDEEKKEEFETLLGGLDGKVIGEKDIETFVEPSAAAEFPFPVRYLAIMTLVLLVASQSILAIQCASARSLRTKFLVSEGAPIMREWQATSPEAKVRIYKKVKNTQKTSNTTTAKLSESKYMVTEGESLVVFDPRRPGEEGRDFLRVVSPYQGFAHIFLQNSTDARAINSPLTKVRDDPFVSKRCPLEYLSLPRTGKKHSRFSNAPLALVIGQCLWNASQVLHLFLLISLLVATRPSEHEDEEDKYGWHRRMVARGLLVGTLILLPWAAFVSSNAGHVFAWLTASLIVGVWTLPDDGLVLSIAPTSTGCWSENVVGENSRKSSGSSTFLITEETLCMLCYLGSSIYNSAAGGSYKGWPYFVTLWKKIDSILGLHYQGDLTFLFYHPLLGWDHAAGSFPPFVPDTRDGIARNIAFSGVWTILPTLYAFDFIVMMVMSHKSPGKWVQRSLAFFGLMHFLFWTDMVSYQYGRGFRNDHEDFWHWTEKWSWRIGILVPLYQNCTNGHWGKTAHRWQLLGRIQRWFAATFGIGFFVFQTIQADVVRTYGFLTGGNSSNGLIKRWKLDKKSPLLKKLSYPYFHALVSMWSMYLILQIACFRLNQVRLCRNPGSKSGHDRNPNGTESRSSNLELARFRDEI